MADPKANYLIFTAPQLEHDFVDLLSRVRLFSKVPAYLLHQIFNYSKFVKLQDGDNPIKQGMFDQEIFVLLKGELQVFIENGDENDRVDIIDRPFSFFGERCILGEPRGASIHSSGESLLLGIDLSSLPDLVDALEYPENKLDDEMYRKNKDMYSLFSTVLLERLDKLIKDQYKLNQKLFRIHSSHSLKVSWWKQEVLFTKLFNEFCDNQVAVELDVKKILISVFERYHINSNHLDSLLEMRQVNTSHIYIELVRLHSMGEMTNLNQVIHSIIRHLTNEAHNSRRYIEELQTEDIEIPKIIPLSIFFDRLYNDILQAKVLQKELSRESFLEGILTGSRLNPSMLPDYLQNGNWIEKQFDLAYVMFLACKHCIYLVAEVNQLIAEYIRLIAHVTSPKQLAHRIPHDLYSLQEEFLNIYETYGAAVEEELAKTKKKNKEEIVHSGSDPDHDIEDLLSKFGM